jgi:hypothetical protein
MKILLDYAFPITQVVPTPNASTSFLKMPLVVAKPKSGQASNVGNIYECVNMTQVAARTDNVEAQQLFNAGLAKVLVLLADNLDIAAYMADVAKTAKDYVGDFFTILVSSDFTDDDIQGVKSSLVKDDLTFTAKVVGEDGDDISVAFLDGGTAGSEVITVVGTAISISGDSTVSTAQQIANALNASEEAMALISVAVASGQGAAAQTAFALDNLENGLDAIALGTFKGVTGVYSDDEDVCEAQATIENRAAFFANSTNKAKNMFFAFGSMLAHASDWLNQQYIQMPFNDGVEELGEALSLFNDKVSFVINDEEFNNRLSLFACGGVAIAAPYIKKNLCIDLQSRALQWISANQPQYTVKEAALLETRLEEDVINDYVLNKGWIESGNVEITISPTGNFTATGSIEIPQPKALWRVESELRETV